jgi:glyoxylate reductase
MDFLEARFDVDLFEGDGAIPREELLRRVAGKDGIVSVLTERIDEELLDAAGPRLRVVANHAVGYDNVDVEACTRRGVLVTNTPDVLTETTADMAWALLLAAARRIAEGDRLVRSGTPWIWGPTMMLGADVHRATLGVVGFGRIGRAVARRALGFEMRVLYHSRSRAAEEIERDLRAEHVSFERLLAESDFVSINASLTPETRHLFDEDALRTMKPTAVLVNTARGPLVDEATLARALREGWIGAAGIDVYEREPEVHPDLAACDNAVLVPHLGSATVGTREAMGMLAAENLKVALDGRRPPTPVNPVVLEKGGA